MSPDPLSNNLYEGTDRKFLDAIFETVHNGLQVLEVKYDDQHKVVDFKYVLANNPLPGNDKNSVFSAQPDARKGRLFRELNRVIETGKPLDDVLQYGDEEPANWFHIKAQKFGDYILISREDLTGSRHAEEKLTHLNRSLFTKNRELETMSSELKTFTAIAANDYNETLRNLYTCLEFIISNDAKNLSDPGKANVRRAQAAVQKMKLLTDDIVSFSKITSDEPVSRIELNKLVAVVLNNLNKKIAENQADVTYADLPVINGYPLLLSVLFTHLIDNAIKFRKENVRPKISVEYTKQDGVDIDHAAAIKDINYDIVSIIDNGIGIDIKDIEKIFTMFYQLNEKGKSKGSGIGLAICKKIMNLHGGFIVAGSETGFTTFSCYFPIEKN